MKYAEFNIDSNKIEFLNSAFGIETVLLNGKKISKKFSFSGIKHKIRLNSKDLTLESKYKQFNNREIELKLKENEKLIEGLTIKVDKKQSIYWMIIGAAFGIGIYKLLVFLFEYFSH